MSQTLKSPSLFMYRRKELQAKARGQPLRRVLNAASLVSIGVGCTIGAGLFSLTGIAAAENAGPGVLLSYILGAIACGFAGLCYSELASMIPVAGSAYTYAYVTMGEFIAWIIGWDLVLEYGVGAATVAVSWSQYINSLLGHWGISLPPRLLASPFETVVLANGNHVHGLVNLPALFIICVLSLLLMRGITESARVNNIIVIIKLAVIVTVIAFGVPYINTSNYVPFIPENNGTFGHYGWSGVIRGAGTVFFAYVGFDAVSTAAQEAKNPTRDIPIGILGSLFICTLAYVLFSCVLTGLVNYKDMIGDAAPVMTAINKTPYEWLKILVGFGVICGFTSVMLVLLLGQSRIFYTMSNDGLLPRFFSKTHTRRATPWYSHIFFMVGTGLLAAFLPIEKLAHMTSIGTLFAFIVVCISVMILRKTEPDRYRKFRMPGGMVIPVCGIISCMAMMLSLDIMTWVRLVVWLVIGIVIYLFYGRVYSHLSPHSRLKSSVNL